MGKLRRITNIMLALAAVFLTGAFIMPKSAVAASYVANYVGATVRGNWVRVGSDGSVSMEVVPTAEGSLSVGKNIVTVETNASTGYRLYVSAQNAEANGYSALYFNGDKTNTTDIIRGIPTDTPTAFSTANQWGYAVAKSGSNGFSEGATYEDVADAGTITDTSTISGLKWRGMKSEYQAITSTSTSNENSPHQVPVYYGVYVKEDGSNHIMTGSYRNIVIYTAFVDGGDDIAMTPGVVEDGATITVTTEHQNQGSTPVSADHIELTLYDKENPSSAIATCDNIAIDPTYNGSYGNPLRFSCTIHMGANAQLNTNYDMLLRVDPEGKGIYISYTKDNNWQFIRVYEMQDPNSVIACQNAPAGTLTKVVDNRDGKKYYVSKLADGNCWMMQDLDLDLYINEAGSGQGNMYAKKLGGGTTLLSNENTDISTATWNVSGSHKAYNTQETIGTAWDNYGRNGGTNNTYEVRSFDNYITVSGEVKRNVCMKTYSTKTADSTTNINNPNAVVCGTAGSGTEASEVGEANTQRIGNYYNWPAATAGTGYHNYPSANQYDHATSSICPAGWHLPTGSQSSTTGGEFNTMLKLEIPAITATGGTNYTSMTDPIMQKLTGYTNADNGYKLTFLRSGNYAYSSAAVANRGSSGFYWSSTVNNANGAFYLNFNASNVYPGTFNLSKGLGYSVRCVAD